MSILAAACIAIASILGAFGVVVASAALSSQPDDPAAEDAEQIEYLRKWKADHQ